MVLLCPYTCYTWLCLQESQPPGLVYPPHVCDAPGLETVCKQPPHLATVIHRSVTVVLHTVPMACAEAVTVRISLRLQLQPSRYDKTLAHDCKELQGLQLVCTYM